MTANGSLTSTSSCGREPLPRCKKANTTIGDDMTTVKGVPYRTPACDRHLPDNESELCPWCEIERLHKVIEKTDEGTRKRFDEYRTRIKGAIEMATEYGATDGAHHKMWVIDQMMRNLLTEQEYETEIACFEAGDDGKPWYEWDEGIPP